MTDINELLEKVYKLDSENQDRAIDAILDFVFDSGDFASMNEYYEAMNEFYDKFDVSRITKGGILCTAPMITFKYIPQIKNHLPYCERAIQRYRELGKTEEEINAIMRNLMSVGDYWKTMELLGAGELFGKKPE